MSVPSLCWWLYVGDTQEALGKKKARCLPQAVLHVFLETHVSPHFGGPRMARQVIYTETFSATHIHTGQPRFLMPAGSPQWPVRSN